MAFILARAPVANSAAAATFGPVCPSATRGRPAAPLHPERRRPAEHRGPAASPQQAGLRAAAVRAPATRAVCWLQASSFRRPSWLTLHPSGRLIDRAARIAVAIDHPVYDLSLPGVRRRGGIGADYGRQETCQQGRRATAERGCPPYWRGWRRGSYHSSSHRPGHQSREGRGAERCLRLRCRNGAARCRFSPRPARPTAVADAGETEADCRVTVLQTTRRHDQRVGPRRVR